MDFFSGPFTGLQLLLAFGCGLVVGRLISSSDGVLRDTRLDQARRQDLSSRFEDIAPAQQAAVRAALAAGKKIEAIKIVRENTKLGLREAKELVERL